MIRRDTREEFIMKARAVHGDKYNYDKVEYVNNHTLVTITCPIHGDFPQTPGNHKRGNGCPYCAIEAQTKTVKAFIADAKRIHGNKYDYSFVEIKGNNKTKVKIKCNTCGTVFEQKINNHLNGQGCPECAKRQRAKFKTKTAEDVIKEFIEVHGNKYSYDKVEYKGDKIKVTITCPIHGDFPMTPNNHKAGQGCPSCNQSHIEEQTKLLLEKNNIRFEPQKRFSWLRNKRKMPLDFYLPEYNAAIECQGIQHYETSGNIFTKEKVEYTQQNDILKYNLCIEHGILIYYVKYNDSVEERINEILNQLKQ